MVERERERIHTLIESEGSDPDRAACLADAKLSTSSIKIIRYQILCITEAWVSLKNTIRELTWISWMIADTMLNDRRIADTMLPEVRNTVPFHQ